MEPTWRSLFQPPLASDSFLDRVQILKGRN